MGHKKVNKLNLVGVDLFAGAGGMALGASRAGIDIKLAIESDRWAAETYRQNHPKTRVIVDDIRNVKGIDVKGTNMRKILFGGPPCQGFSISNQRTRNVSNPHNWLFKEFIRLVGAWKPHWVVFENVKGILETKKGMFLEYILEGLSSQNYKTEYWVLNSADFGVPQRRNRLFVIGTISGDIPDLFENKLAEEVSVGEAILDLPIIDNGASVDWLLYSQKAHSSYSKTMRNGSGGCYNNLVTKNASNILKRYQYIPQGGNWEDIPDKLMDNYKNLSKCHTGIYRRLKISEPSIVICNYRKNMLIHPTQNRGLSVREAARLQSFPDWYRFMGSIGFQQQQVSNAVPPLMAEAVFNKVVGQIY